MPRLRPSPHILYAGILGLASLCIHVIPFIFYSPNPLGYDTGFYRRYVIQPFASFPNAPVPGLGDNAWGPRILLDILHGIHVPPDIALYGSYLLLQALLPILIFFLLRRSIGTGSALLASAFVIFSSVGYHAFWYFLYKSIFALDVMLLALIAHERKRPLMVCVLSIIIALSHATSAIVYLLTLAALFGLERGRRREVALYLAMTATAFTLVNMPLFREATYVLPTALFLEWRQFLWLSVPFGLLLAINGRALWRGPLPLSLVAFTGVSLAYPLFHLPFYERIFVYADIGLAALSAYAAYALVKTFLHHGPAGFANTRAALLCVAIGLMLGNLSAQIHSLRPLISEKSLTRIESIGAMVPSGALILTSANEAPWYEGWTTAHIAAPGLLHDTHNLEAWDALWSATSTEQARVFLNSFDQPLYVSTLDGPDVLLGGLKVRCLTEISETLYRSECVASEKNAKILLATQAHPIHATAAGVFNLSSDAAWIWNGDVAWPMASLTKIMTALVADRFMSSTQNIQITTAAEGPLDASKTQPTFLVGDTLSQRDLVAAMLIESSNDAAEALARAYGYDDFIGKMDEEATRLHMLHTVFENASGLSSKNISTVADLALLVKYVWAHDPQLLATTRLASSTVSVMRGGTLRQIPLTNINALAGSSTFLGGKTGTWPEANQNLIAIFQTKNGPQLVIILGADDRYKEAQSILSAF